MRVTARLQSGLGRAVSTFAALVMLFLLSPVFLVLMVLVRTGLGAPVFFTQLRPGWRGKPFRMVKFRSMTNDRDADGELLPDAERLTSIGRMLRSTSLDELPELWNVLKGEMNFVGPRPLLMEYLSLYDERQARRHEVKPGITGWSQVKGRNALSWSDKLEFDVWYVEHRSLFLDLRILTMTIHQVLRRHGISADGEATTTKFVATRTTD